MGHSLAQRPLINHNKAQSTGAVPPAVFSTPQENPGARPLDDIGVLGESHCRNSLRHNIGGNGNFTPDSVSACGVR